MKPILLRGIGELLTLEGAWKKSGCHIKEDDLGLIPKAALLISSEGQIVAAGPEKKVLRECAQLTSKIKKNLKEIHVQGQSVLPGWIDCHTHTVFAGNRWEEFEMRCQGASYQEIAQRGGGILSTMKATRQISPRALHQLSQLRVNEFMRQGVTTLEIKSGYALDLKGELKQLSVIKKLKGPKIVSTFLGAHAKPPEFKTHEDYLKYLAHSVLPVIKQKKLAQRVDIFVEKNFFEVEAAKVYLEQAKKLGFELTIHADQLSLSGGTSLAVTLGASSADHVIQIGEKEIKELASSFTSMKLTKGSRVSASPLAKGPRTTAVLLPLADLYMKCAYPPARALIDGGARVALATDFNPGSCPSQDVQLVGLLARLQMQMTLPEIISAWTVGGAAVLGLNDVGSLQKGFRADVQVMDSEWRGLFYQAGRSPVTQLFVKGVQLV